MIDYLSANQGVFWLIAGLVMLIIEGLVLGLGTGVLLFSALAALATGALLLTGVVPNGWLNGIATFAILSAVLTALLWKPLKALQRGPRRHQETSSDFIGLEFRLDQALTREHPGNHRYSGVNWRVELDTSSAVPALEAGKMVTVVGIDAGVLRVVERRQASDRESQTV